MDDEWIAGVALLGSEYRPHCLLIERIGTQSVDGLGREGDETSSAYDRCSIGDNGGSRNAWVDPHNPCATATVRLHWLTHAVAGAQQLSANEPQILSVRGRRRG